MFYTQRNEGKFVIVESRAPSGYYGDWTDVNAPDTAGSVLGKRAYAFEITKALDAQTIWLGNADYNADISTTNSGGTLIDTGESIVTITFGIRNADKTYATDPTGIANNEDSYTMHANADKMQNDRVLGNILLTKVDLDAARYLAAAATAILRWKVLCTICTPLTPLNTRTAFRVWWITPKSPMPTARPFGTPLSSPMAAGIRIIYLFCRKIGW